MDKRVFSKENPLLAGVYQGKRITPWFLAPFICYLILELMGPVQSGLTGVLLKVNLGIQDWWNILDLFSVSLTILAFFLWVRLVEWRPVRSMGLPKKGALAAFAKGAILGSCMITGLFLILLALEAARLDRIQFNPATLFSWFLVAVGYVIQASAEEIYMRGWLLPVISAKTNPYLGLAISSCMFAVIHLGNNGVSLISSIHTALFALLAAVYALKAGNIWGVCGIHFAWNFLQGNLYGFHVSGFDSQSSLLYFSTKGSSLLTGGAYGPEGGIPGVLICLLALVYVIFFMNRQWDKSPSQ